MRCLEGDRTPEMRRGRERLTVRNPRVDSAVAGLAIDDEDVAEARRFGNAVLASFNRWSAGREVNSLSERRLSKFDAGRLLRIRIAELEGGAQ